MHYSTKRLVCLLAWGICFASLEANEKTAAADPSPNQTEQPMTRSQWTGKEEVAYIEDDEKDLQKRAFREERWDDKSNWRYHKEAYYRGEIDPRAYRTTDRDRG